MEHLTSRDGTELAYDRIGSGPAVVLICGGSVDRMSNASLAEALATDFTVYNFDRRGRGDSGNTLPYAVEGEIEDINAVIDAAGGSACLFPKIEAAEKVMQGMEDGLRAALPQLDAVLAEPSPSVAH